MNFDVSATPRDDQAASSPKSVSLISEEVKLRLTLKELALSAIRSGVLITDPNQADNPIIYANEGFARLTGYTREEIIGRNCRFLQGPESNHDALAIIRKAIQEGTDCNVILLNYRKDGTSFWNHLEITAVRENESPEGRLIYFVAVQNDVTAIKNERELLQQANQRLEKVLTAEREARIQS